MTPARIAPLGDTAFLVEFSRIDDPEAGARARGLCAALESAALPGVLEWAPAFASATVWYDCAVCDPAALRERLEGLAREARAESRAGARWRLPVCFAPEFAPDLDELAQSKGLAREAAVEILCGARFRAQMLGFLPGFAYLSGLPEILETTRLSTPRPAVPAGSVALAGRFCAAYPWESPGGWRLIGRTPAPLFDPGDEERPALIGPGDLVGWRPVGRDEYEALAAQARAGALSRALFRDPGESE